MISPLGSLRKGALNNARPSTGNGLFAFMSGGFAQYFGPIVSIRVKKLSKISWVASGHIEREKGSHSVDVRGTVSLRSRRLQVVGTRKNGRARRRHARGEEAPSPLACLPRARPFSLSPATSKLRRLGTVNAFA